MWCSSWFFFDVAVRGIAGIPVALRGTQQKSRESSTHIDSDMAHHTSMMGETDILVLVVYTVGLHGTPRAYIIVDNECARDVDLDRAGVADCLLQASGALATNV